MVQSETLEAALRWLSKGVVPVPLLEGSKRPVMAWAKLQRCRPPATLVRRWFQEPRNLGLICGKVSGGLVVLDFDKVVHYYRWAESNLLARSYTVQTARGRHVYLYLEEVPALSLAMVGGEVKASGYVVAPPSIHPSGTPYRALNEDARILRTHDLGMAGVELPAEPLPAPRLTEMPGSPKGSGLIDEIKETLPMTVFLARHGRRLRPTSPDGVWLMTNCLFHVDNTPSMWVNARWNVCRCFKPSCPGHRRVMDVINAYALLHGLSNQVAIQALAAELGL